MVKDIVQFAEKIGFTVFFLTFALTPVWLIALVVLLVLFVLYTLAALVDHTIDKMFDKP